MSVILAARNYEGIFVGYDTVSYPRYRLHVLGKVFEVGTPAFIRRYVRKVEPICEGRGLIGFSGTVHPDHREFQFVDESLKQLQENCVVNLEQVFQNPELMNLAFIVGIIDGEKTRLFYGKTYSGFEFKETLAHCIYHNYPEPAQLFRSNYNYGMKREQIIDLIRENINEIKKISKEREPIRRIPKGFGLAELTQNGYRELIFSKKD